MSFLHAILCYNKPTDSVTFSIDAGVMSIQKYINSIRRQWGSTAIKRMRERLKPGLFSSSSGLGTRLCSCMQNTRWSPKSVTSDIHMKQLLSRQLYSYLFIMRLLYRCIVTPNHLEIICSQKGVSSKRAGFLRLSMM